MAKRFVEADDALLSQVPFGRSKALAFLGALLFNTALQVVAPERASAASPYPCYGPDACPSCSGYDCTYVGCQNDWYACPETLNQCWSTCDCLYVYKCCDYYFMRGQVRVSCTCSGVTASCGPPC